jgi:hypothetical protein
VVIGVQEPRVYSVPAFTSTLGVEAVELAASVGLVLDPWQAFVLHRALGQREDGKWAAFEVGVDVARQNGKGAILEARELVGLFLTGEDLIIHSAHQFDTSMEAFLRMEDLLESNADLSRQVKAVSRSHGSEGFTLKTGQRLRYRTRTKGGGRGFTGTTLMLDEAMVLPESFHGALLPTVSGQSELGNPQVWYTGSAVDQLIQEDGVVFARVRERGHKGDDPSLAYFEWSVDAGEDVLPDQVEPEIMGDPGLWATANPGLGIRISVEHIEHELRSMDSRTFAVERLGIGDWPVTDKSLMTVISLELWERLTDKGSEPIDPLCFALDVSPDRDHACIAVSGTRTDGFHHIEIVEHRSGTGWVVDRLAELSEKHDPLAVLCDERGPAASLVAELLDRHVPVQTVKAAEYAQSCGSFFDTVEQEKVRHLAQPPLKAALRGVKTRPLGDAWAWGRKKSTVDITPLVAVTLALWGSMREQPSVYEDREVVAI